MATRHTVILQDVALLAGNTSRSKAYVQALIRHGLHPEHAYLLGSPTRSSLPGQLSSDQLQNERGRSKHQFDPLWPESNFSLNEPIEYTLANAVIPFTTIESADINSTEVVEAVANISQEVLIYSGYGGALLRKPILATGKRFLHIHGGYLPEYKGSTTNYYSLLADGTLGASSIFLTENIDCGPILVRKKFPAPPDCTLIDHVYDNAVRADVLVETMKRYVQTGTWDLADASNVGGETYFVIHPVLRHIAILAKQ